MLSQVFTRPAMRMNNYTTPVHGLYLCSASTPPGGGVHGMCGYWAARSVMRRAFGGELPSLPADVHSLSPAGRRALRLCCRITPSCHMEGQ
jgi:hypothetical protein